MITTPGAQRTDPQARVPAHRPAFRLLTVTTKAILQVIHDHYNGFRGYNVGGGTMHFLLDDDLGRLTLRRLRPWHRVLASSRAARLDRELADGMRPEASASLAARAMRLTSTDFRRDLAASLRRILAAAGEPSLAIQSQPVAARWPRAESGPAPGAQARPNARYPAGTRSAAAPVPPAAVHPPFRTSRPPRVPLPLERISRLDALVERAAHALTCQPGGTAPRWRPTGCSGPRTRCARDQPSAPPRIPASVLRLMLPPDTTHTTFPVPARPLSAAGASGDQTPGQGAGWREHDRVGRPADLERVDGLEVLQLEVDLGRGPLDLQRDQRCPDHRARDARPRRLDVGQLDHGSARTPGSGARPATARSIMPSSGSVSGC
jgi:hypothetical protein